MILQCNSMEVLTKRIMNIPLLEREEEIELLKKIKNNCKESRNLFIKHNLKNVLYVCNKFVNYKMDKQDLFQEGCIGLMKSIEKFDINAGVRFITFAYFDIKAHIKEYITKNFKIVKFSTSHNRRKAFDNIRTLMKNSVDSETVSYKELNQIADDLNIDVKTVVEAYTYYCGTINIDSEENDVMSFDPSLIDHQSPETQLITKQTEQKNLLMLTKGFEILTETQRHAITEYFLHEKTLAQIAGEIGVSHQSVDCSIKRGLKKLNEWSKL